jgi:transposase-like protein
MESSPVIFDKTSQTIYVYSASVEDADDLHSAPVEDPKAVPIAVGYTDQQCADNDIKIDKQRWYKKLFDNTLSSVGLLAHEAIHNNYTSDNMLNNLDIAPHR